MDPGPRSEEDLQALIGQYESIRLDFKASALLNQPTDRVVKQLTEDVSAFANTEGGVIVIGVRESKSGKRSVAAEVDEGVDPDQMSPERLEQLIASNLSPPVPGLAVRPIALAGDKAGRLAYVVSVPRGTTAYQARHSLLYYGRSEFAAVPLHDNVIRMLMNRGRYAHACIELEAMSHCRYADETKEVLRELVAREPEGSPVAAAPKEVLAAAEQILELNRACVGCAFRLILKNDGPVTIRDAALSVSVRGVLRVKCVGSGQATDWGFGVFRTAARASSDKQPWEFALADSRLFPGQSLPFPGAGFVADVPPGGPISTDIIEWALYLDDAPSLTGFTELASVLKPACREP